MLHVKRRLLPSLAAAFTLFAAAISCAQAQTPAATTNGSVAITAGNTFQSVLPALTFSSTAPVTGRRSLTIQNNNTNGDNCWIEFGVGVTAANATKGASILLAQGASFTRYYPYVPSDAIQATCATTADTLYVDTQ